MKQKVLPNLLRKRYAFRRGKKDIATTSEAEGVDKVTDDNPSGSNIHQVLFPVSSARIVHHKVDTDALYDALRSSSPVSGTSSDEWIASFSEQIPDDDDAKDATKFDMNRVNTFNVSPQRRDEMWYKNQMYLLQKEQKEVAQRCNEKYSLRKHYDANERSLEQIASGEEEDVKHPWRISPRKYYESDEREDSFDRSSNSHCSPKHSASYSSSNQSSPIGVDEFESINKYKGLKKTDSLLEAQRRRTSNNKTHQRRRHHVYEDDDSKASWEEDDTTCTQQTESLLNDDDTRTQQSSSLYTYDDVDTTLEDVTIDDTECNSCDDGTLEETILSSLNNDDLDDDDDTMSYVFELLDDNSRKHAKHKPNHKSVMKPHPILKKSSAHSRRSSLTSQHEERQVTVRVRRDPRGRKYVDEESVLDVACPCIPSFKAIKDEIEDTCNDTLASINQVMYAFFISEDDIDRMADKIRDAKLEVKEKYHEQVKERSRVLPNTVGTKLTPKSKLV